jgi:hypothetical protein
VEVAEPEIERAMKRARGMLLRDICGEEDTEEGENGVDE